MVSSGEKVQNLRKCYFSCSRDEIVSSLSTSIPESWKGSQSWYSFLDNK